MACYLLVHGEFCGGWIWREVADALSLEGHEVHTPSLTGLGDRSHLLTAETGLSIHVADIANYISSYDLRNVILVAHGYGGLAACGAAEHRVRRIARMVFLDGIPGVDGRSWMDLADEGAREDMRTLSATTPEGWKVPPLTPSALGVMCASDIERTVPRLGPMPMKAFAEPLSIPKAEYLRLPCSYALCINPVHSAMVSAAAAEAKRRNWQYHELVTSHMAMVNTPEEVVRILLYS